jgi:plastocyanin
MSRPSASARRRWPVLSVLAIVVLASLFILAGCGGSTSGATTSGTTSSTPTASPTTAPSPTASGAQATVTIGGVSTYRFSPQTFTVKVGTTVTWTNNSQAPHTVTSDDGAPASFNGSLDSSGGTFSFTFAQAGTYNYHCSVHPYMTGTITVTP